MVIVYLFSRYLRNIMIKYRYYIQNIMIKNNKIIHNNAIFSLNKKQYVQFNIKNMFVREDIFIISIIPLYVSKKPMKITKKMMEYII